MESSELEQELSCSICLCIFSEPVTLCCGHSFCRGCITAVPEDKCPQCRALLPPAADLQLLPTSRTLQSLAQRAKERPEQRPRPGTRTGTRAETRPGTRAETRPGTRTETRAETSPGARAETRPGTRTGAAEELCPEHEERMKLFCVTDQKLACIICRDGEEHHGHRFKPIREAAAALRQDIGLELAHVEGQMEEIQNLSQTQRAEVQKAKELSGSVRNQVQRDFQAMQQFLRRREDEILNELRVQQEDALENMNQSLKAMNQALSECGDLTTSWTQVMEVSDPEMFLRRWSEEHAAAAGQLSNTWTEKLAVVQSPLFQGPYQSHLQFFIWKEMLQMVEPKAELLTLRDDNPQITVSEDKTSFHCAPQNVHQKSHKDFTQSTGSHQKLTFDLGQLSSPSFGQADGGLFGQTSSSGFGQTFGSFIGQTSSPSFGFSQTSSSGFGFDQATSTGFSFATSVPPQVVVKVPQSLDVSSSSSFSLGQQYWEVEVRLRNFWCVGVTGYFLKYENEKYFACEEDKSTELSFSRRLLKVGVYLNCSSRTLSFYDADSMERLEKVRCEGLSLPTRAFFRIRKTQPDKNPLNVWRY